MAKLQRDLEALEEHLYSVQTVLDVPALILLARDLKYSPTGSFIQLPPADQLAEQLVSSIRDRAGQPVQWPAIQRVTFKSKTKL